MLIRTGLGGQLSGSVGGVTAAHNRGGQYLRNRSIPVNPNTNRQQSVRAAFATATEAWKNLSAIQQGAWTSYANSTPVTNRLGESITLTGHNMYVRTNAFLLGLGGTLLAVAPSTPGQSTLGTGRVITASVATGVAFAVGAATADGLTLVSYGPSISNGVSGFRGPYSVFAVPTMTGTGFAATAQSFSRYGALVAGERRPFRIASIDSDGRLSDVFEQIVTVVA